MNKQIAIVLTTLAVTPAFADGHASPDVTDLYGFGYLGVTSLQDPTFTGTIGGAPQSVETFFDDTGTNIGIGIGRAFPQIGDGVRGEISLSYSNSDINNTNFSGNGPAQEDANGDISSTRILASIYKDFETDTIFTPYVGAGLGFSNTEFDITYAPGVTLSDSDQNLSAELAVGGSFTLTDTLALTTDIRYTRDFSVESRRLNPAGALTGTVSDDIENVSFNVGLRFAF